MAEVSRVCKKLALTYNIFVVLLSQLRREAENHFSGRPQLSDLRESGAIEQDADVVILLDQPAKQGKAVHKETGYPTEGMGVAIVAKNRNGETGDVLYQHDEGMLHITDYVCPQKWLDSIAEKQRKERESKENGATQDKKWKPKCKRNFFGTNNEPYQIGRAHV